MSWFNVDDGLTFHPKVVAAGNAAIGAWVRLGAYCSCHLTDGRVPVDVAATIATAEELAALVKVGMLRKARGHYELHQYLQRNRTKERVEADREKARERMARMRQRQSQPLRRNRRVTNAVSDATQSSVPNGTDSAPASEAAARAVCAFHKLQLPCSGCAADRKAGSA